MIGAIIQDAIHPDCGKLFVRRPGAVVGKSLGTGPEQDFHIHPFTNRVPQDVL